MNLTPFMKEGISGAIKETNVTTTNEV